MSNSSSQRCGTGFVDEINTGQPTTYKRVWVRCRGRFNGSTTEMYVSNPFRQITWALAGQGGLHNVVVLRKTPKYACHVLQQARIRQYFFTQNAVKLLETHVSGYVGPHNIVGASQCMVVVDVGAPAGVELSPFASKGCSARSVSRKGVAVVRFGPFRMLICRSKGKP